MDHQVQTPNPPVTMLSGYVTQQDTELTVYCHDAIFKRATAVDGAGKDLFRVEGTSWGKSWSWRRRVWDQAGDRPLFDLRHESISIKNGWVVETPDDRQRLCSLVHRSFLTREHSAINATVRTETGEQVLVVMRQRDLAATSTTVSVGDDTVATIEKSEDNDTMFLKDRDRSIWKAQVGPGVDLSLVSEPYIIMYPC